MKPSERPRIVLLSPLLGWGGAASSRVLVPLMVSVASHGVGALVLSTVQVELATLPEETQFLEIVAVDAPEPPADTVRRPPSVSPRATAVPGLRPRLPAPQEQETQPEVTETPNYEETASLSDILLAPSGSGNTNFSLAVPNGAVAAAQPEGAGPTPQSDSLPETLEEREAAIEAELAARMERAANARNYLSQRPPPELRQRRDGSYAYSGPRFAAVIEADGTVNFEDRSNVDVSGSGTDNGPGLAGTFDLLDAIQGAAGQDPMRAERRWFMRETRELRERLEEEARQREESAGLSRMERRLRDLWAASETPRSKRRRLFALWNGLSEDEVGSRGRRVIEAFIRRNLPAGSEDAYSDSELQQLNRERDGDQAFRPYR